MNESSLLSLYRLSFGIRVQWDTSVTELYVWFNGNTFEVFGQFSNVGGSSPVSVFLDVSLPVLSNNVNEWDGGKEMRGWG